MDLEVFPLVEQKPGDSLRVQPSSSITSVGRGNRRWQDRPFRNWEVETENDKIVFFVSGTDSARMISIVIGNSASEREAGGCPLPRP